MLEHISSIIIYYCEHLSGVQHDRARRSLCERLKPYSLPAGHAACQEGDEADTVWLLTEGAHTLTADQASHFLLEVQLDVAVAAAHVACCCQCFCCC